MCVEAQKARPQKEQEHSKISSDDVGDQNSIIGVTVPRQGESLPTRFFFLPSGLFGEEFHIGSCCSIGRRQAKSDAHENVFVVQQNSSSRWARWRTQPPPLLKHLRWLRNVRNGSLGSKFQDTVDFVSQNLEVCLCPLPRNVRNGFPNQNGDIKQLLVASDLGESS